MGKNNDIITLREGAVGIKVNSRQYQRLISEAIGRVRYGLAQDLKNNIKEVTPVKTGRLKKNIGAYATKDQIVVVANTPYAEYVEFGTMYMLPRLYMRTGVYNAIGVMLDDPRYEKFDTQLNQLHKLKNGVEKNDKYIRNMDVDLKTIRM